MKTTNEQNLKNKNHGITLIALIITIIVMLILVAVTVTMAVNGGLFEKAASAGRQTNEARDKELELAEGETIQDLINKYTTSTGVDSDEEDDEEFPTSPYLGCYVDIDGVEGMDGIIYADLGVGNTKNGDVTAVGSYTIPVETNLKEYEISENVVDGPFGERNVVTLVDDDEMKNERFYVMALKDFTTNEYETFYWDKNENEVDYGISYGFGAGVDNTKVLIEYWDDIEDTSWVDGDIWKYLEADDRWFVPTNSEWVAFLNELNLIKSNSRFDGPCGLSGGYLLSDSIHEDGIVTLGVFNGYWYSIFSSGEVGDLCIRLSTTF